MTGDEVCRLFSPNSKIHTILRRDEIDGEVFYSITEQELIDDMGCNKMQAKAIIRKRDALKEVAKERLFPGAEKERTFLWVRMIKDKYL